MPARPLEGHQLGLVQQVKAVERLVIEAATTGSEQRAVEAFALHPLVDSVTVARELLRGYRARIPLGGRGLPALTARAGMPPGQRSRAAASSA